MKGKKNIYFLLPLALLIWGVIGYKVWEGIKRKDIISSKPSSMLESTSNSKIDTFDILDNYPDPFLKYGFNRKQERRPESIVSNNNSSLKKNDPRTVNQIKTWPDIIFLGSMKNRSSKRELAFLKINGADYSLKTGEKIENIKLIAILKDSIIVEYQKVKRGFKRI